MQTQDRMASLMYLPSIQPLNFKIQIRDLNYQDVVIHSHRFVDLTLHVEVLSAHSYKSWVDEDLEFGDMKGNQSRNFLSFGKKIGLFYNFYYS
jgi:hypothetical protein